MVVIIMASTMLVVIMMMRVTWFIFCCRSDIPHGRSEKLDVCENERGRMLVDYSSGLRCLRLERGELLLRGDACGTGLMLRSERLDGHQLPLQRVIVSCRTLVCLSFG